MTQVRQLTLKEAQDLIAEAQRPLVFACGAPWCIDCRRAAPFFMKFAQTMADKAIFGAANVDDEPALREVFNVVHIPTMMVFKDGKEVGRIVEVQTPGELKAFLEEHLG